MVYIVFLGYNIKMPLFIATFKKNCSGSWEPFLVRRIFNKDGSE